MSEVVLITTPDATAQLTLNRSESCNALKVETAQALTRALLDVGADPRSFTASSSPAGG